MTKVQRQLTTAISCAVLAVSLSAPAMAASSEAAKVETVMESITVPGHARTVLSSVRNARLALFDGQTDAARDLVAKARETFDKSTTKYALKLADGKHYGVPVDSSVEFAEGFEPSKEQILVIQQAGSKVQQGEAVIGYRQMLDAGVSLSVKYAMLPVLNTMTQLEKAQADMDNKHFYKANLALKSIENSVLIESFGATETPQQGYTWEAVSGS